MEREKRRRNTSKEIPKSPKRVTHTSPPRVSVPDVSVPEESVPESLVPELPVEKGEPEKPVEGKVEKPVEGKVEKPIQEELEPLNVGEEPEIKEGKKLKQCAATMAVCLGSFMAGTFLAWTSSALQTLGKQNSTDFPLEEPITKDQGMWIGSLLAIGALFTAFPMGFLADRIGRKNVLLALALPCIMSWLIIIFADKVEAIYGARLLAGFSVGGICVIIPLYIGEIAEKKIRGALGSCFQLLLTLGILYSYVVGALLSYRWLNVFCGVVPIIFILCILFIPETPYYYVYRNKNSLAGRSIKWLCGKKYNFHPRLNHIQEEVVQAKRNKAHCKELIATKSSRRALLIALGLMFFQQLCGINAVIFYTTQIFIYAGSNLRPEMCTIIVGGVQVVATIFAVFLVDRIGRRVLLLLSGSVMSFCLVIFGVYFYLKESNEEMAQSVAWIPLVAVNLFITCFSLGYGPLPWLMIGELFASNIKGLASGLAVTVNWLLVFIVTKTFQDLINLLDTAGTFWFFGAITIAGFVFVAIFVKETKGKTFGEIHVLLDG